MGAGEVSILTRPGGRVLLAGALDDELPLSICFNPHPAPGAGCCRPLGLHKQLDQQQVSILTRPGGRVLRDRSRGGRLAASSCFNPHPARGPGAARRGCRLRIWRLGSFNPHPARGPGAAEGPCPNTNLVSDTFQSSPGPGAGCCRGAQLMATIAAAFQSSPGPGAGCCRWPSRYTNLGLFLFQSSPGPGAGCCRRVLPPPGTLRHPFQSSPGPGAGCCLRRDGQRPGDPRFNPHPARGPGAACATGYRCPMALHRFNPHPARGPGAAW